MEGLKCTKDANYSLKTGYHVAHMQNIADKGASTSFQQHHPSFWNQVWNIKVPQKIKLFLWKICQNAIPVKDNLFKRKLINSPLCQVCNSERETIEHALLLCPWTSLVWFGS